jgi:hypothetical protein
MMKTLLFILIAVLSHACISVTNITDTDDLYFSSHANDTIISKRVVRSPKWNTTYYTPNYGWYGMGYNYGYPYNWYRPQVIIVQPKPEPDFRYGKRPDREGNSGVAVPLNRRRGRD